MQDVRLVIFVKNPELGKVKTRLAKTVGDQKALDVYLKLIEFTKNIVEPLECRKEVYFSNSIPVDNKWEGYTQKVQKGNDLGERLLNAFNDDPAPTIIIGSDCAEITTSILSQAIMGLPFTDTVFGPAKDGGYYLIGMKEVLPYLFEDMPWSTGSLLNLSLEKLKREKQSFFLLHELSDIDTEEDLNAASWL